MTSPSDLPNDLSGCHALIEQQRADLQASKERVAHLEAQLAEHKETIADQQQTITNLAADNKLLKRSLFGSRRERYEDPAQGVLFDVKLLEEEAAEEEGDKDGEKSTKRKKKRTSKGRQRRVFPDFLAREEERHPLKEEDIPEQMRDNPNVRRFFKKVGEQLELIPMQLKVVEQYQEVMVLLRMK